MPPLLAFDNTKHKYLLFDTIPSPDTEGSNCITDAMSHIAEGACPKNINMVTDLVTYLTVAKLNVAIIYNSVKPLKTFGSGSVQRRMKVGKGGQKLMSLITTEDIHNNHLALNILYGDPTTADYILVYDIIHEHIEMASFPLTIRPHIYINTFQICEWIPSTGKTLVIRDYDRKISNEVPVFNVKWNAIFYVFFTIKTVPDYTQDGLVQPYACSYAIFKEDELDLMNDMSIENLAEVRGNRITHFVSYACMTDFLEEIHQIAGNPTNRMVFVGFGNTSKENFIFLDYLSKIKFVRDNERIVQNVFYWGLNMIGGLYFFRNCNVFDLNNHITCSLRKAVDIYGIKVSHNDPPFPTDIEVEHLYNNFKQEANFYVELANLITADDLRLHCEISLMQTAMLFSRYLRDITTVNVIRECMMFYGDFVIDYVTLPALMMKVSTYKNAKNNISLPMLTVEQHDIFDNAARGGRTMAQINTRVSESVKSLDMTGMYATVMMVDPEVEFGYGDIADVVIDDEFIEAFDQSFREYNQFIKIGVIQCTVDQTTLPPNMCKVWCKKVAGQRNDWDNDDRHTEEKVFVLTEDITELVKYGAIVRPVLGGRAILFRDRIRNDELFGWMNELMLMKVRQDELKRAKNPDFNQGLYYILKLAMNSLAGKYKQRPYMEKFDLIDISKFRAIVHYKKNMKPDTAVIINMINDKQGIMSYEALEFKPGKIYVGTSITAHGRRLLLNIISKLNKKDILYTDTDSISLTTRAFDRSLRRYMTSTIIPHRKSIEDIEPRYASACLYEEGENAGALFGSFKNEYEPTANELIIVKKKVKFCCTMDPYYGMVGKPKWALAGICPDAVLVYPEEENEDFITTNDHAQYIVCNQTAAASYAYRYRESRCLLDPYVLYRLFCDLANGKVCYVINREQRTHGLVSHISYVYNVKKLTPGDNKCYD